jgi:hypothetical protein
MMGATHFSGPVVSAAGFISGDSDVIAGELGGTGTNASPYAMGSTADLKLYANYAETTATTGDTRLLYDKLFFEGAGGSGEVHRVYGVVNNVTAATGGTVNGSHISLDINGASGAISGAANAIRATLGGTATTPGGTLAALQVDSNFATGVTLPGSTSFIRVTDTNTTKIPSLLNIPAPANGSIFATHTTQTMTHSIRIVASGVNYYVMCTDSATNRG